MEDRHIKFMDFIFDKMKSKYNERFNIGSLGCEFEKLHGIKINFKEIQYIEERFKIDLFDQFSNTVQFKLSDKSHDMIDEFGSYSSYLKANDEYANRQKEIEDLNIKLSNLQIDNLKYEESNKELKRQVLILDRKTKKWNIIKSYWWFMGILLAIAMLAGDLLDITTP